MGRRKSDGGLYVMGVDPGFAKMGVVVLRRSEPGRNPHVRMAEVVTTKKPEKKRRTNLRVTDDDVRRYGELCSALDGQDFFLNAVGIEAYTLNPKQPGSAGGVKALGVYVGVVFWARTRGLFTVPFVPGDLKRRFCGRMSASKADVEEALRGLVVGLDEVLDSLPGGKREHMADAAGVAYLAMEELDVVRKATGMG